MSTNNNDENEVDIEDEVVFDGLDQDIRVEDKLKKLRNKLKTCEDEKKEYLDGWQRLKADFVNFRKRTEEQKTTSVVAARKDVLLGVLPVLDSFEMAFGNPDALKNLDQNWLNGMQNIQNQLTTILADYSVVVIDPLNEDFDPQLHDSVEMRSIDDKKQDGKIIDVLQKGYEYDGTILRAAKVVVGEYSK